MVHGHRLNVLSINLVKLHNTPQIGCLTTIKSLFSRKKKTTNVPNFFDLHHMLVKDAIIHENRIFIFLNFSQNLLVNPYENIEFFGKCSIY